MPSVDEHVVRAIAEIVRRTTKTKWLVWDVAREIAVNSGYHDDACDIAEAVYNYLYPDELADEADEKEA